MSSQCQLCGMYTLNYSTNQIISSQEILLKVPLGIETIQSTWAVEGYLK